MIDILDKRNYAIDTIDDCLFIGIYNKTEYPLEIAFRFWLEMFFDIKYQILNFKSTISSIGFEPLFLFDLDKDFIFDVIFNRKLILMYLNIDKWLEIGNDIGLRCRWLSRKKSMEYI